MGSIGRTTGACPSQGRPRGLKVKREVKEIKRGERLTVEAQVIDTFPDDVSRNSAEEARSGARREGAVPLAMAGARAAKAALGRLREQQAHYHVNALASKIVQVEGTWSNSQDLLKKT